MTTSSFADAGDRWIVPLGQGADIYSCCFGFAITLHIRDGANVWALRVEHVLRIVRADGSEDSVVPEGSIDQLYPALRCLRREVQELAAHKDGSLHVLLAEGERIHVSADQSFEAWELSGPYDARIVSMPGGELAIWQPSSGS